MFFHLRGSFGLGNIPTTLDRATGEVGLDLQHSSMLRVALAGGFFWRSQLYLEYAYANGEMIPPNRATA